MPLKKIKFNDIKKGVTYEIEGMGALEIAKQLTADCLVQLREKETITHEALEACLAINNARTEQDKISEISAEMEAYLSSELSDREIEMLFIHQKTIRREMNGPLWKDLREEIRKEYIHRIAKEEADKMMDRRKSA